MLGLSDVLITINQQYQHRTNQKLRSWANTVFQNCGVFEANVSFSSPTHLFFALVPTFSTNSCKTLAMQAVTTEDYKHKLKCENGLENDTGTQYFSTCHGSQNGHSFGCWVIFKNLNRYLFWILMFDQF